MNNNKVTSARDRWKLMGLFWEVEETLEEK